MSFPSFWCREMYFHCIDSNFITNHKISTTNQSGNYSTVIAHNLIPKCDTEDKTCNDI